MNQLIQFINFNISPSFDCDQNCSYCIHQNKKGFGKFSLFNELKQFILKYKHPQITATLQINGGEPLLDWDYFYEYTKLLSTIDNTKMVLATSLSGNYTDNQLKYLADTFKSIGVSIDGPEEIHNICRKNFKNVLGNFKRLQNFTNNVFIQNTVTEKNVAFLYDIENYLDTICDKHSYSIDFFTPKENRDYFILEYISQLVQLIKQKGFSALPNLHTRTFYCMDKTQACSIYPNGQVLHCNAQYDPHKVMFDLNKSLELKEGFNNIPTDCYFSDACKNCKAESFCKNGCYAIQSKYVFCSIIESIAKIKEKYYAG